jgi:hypothetical protein
LWYRGPKKCIDHKRNTGLQDVEWLTSFWSGIYALSKSDEAKSVRLHDWLWVMSLLSELNPPPKQ